MFMKDMVMTDGTTVLNCEDYAKNYDFIVARQSEGEWWFWGAWNDIDEAGKAADEIGGWVFRRA
jgi:hypothetical protein